MRCTISEESDQKVRRRYRENREFKGNFPQIDGGKHILGTDEASETLFIENACC